MNQKTIALAGLLASLLVSQTACSKISGTNAHTIAKAQEKMAYSLIDPSSAQFRDVQVVKHKVGTSKYDEDLGETVVCGQINGKNRNGAYVGFSRFVWSKKLNDGLMSPDYDKSFDQVQEMHERCKREFDSFKSGRTSREMARHYCDESSEALKEWQEQDTFEAIYMTQCEPAESEAK